MVIEKKGMDYKAYIEKQGAKSRNPEKRNQILRSVSVREKRFQRVFERIKDGLIPGKILCLGARTGCEVIGARNAGFDGSMGIDLHPMGDKNVVIKGDWHDIPFPDGSFENVFSNSVDHCYDIEKLITEICRVLKPKGRVYLMLSGKQMLKTKKDRGLYMRQSQNFLFWEDGLDLAAEFEKHGFKLLKHDIRKTNWNTLLLRKL
jgi:SAM-dependent methyltransferase